MATTSSKTPDMSWQGKEGFAKLRGLLGFLDSIDIVDSKLIKKYHYLFHYSVQYGLLTGERRVTDAGRELKTYDEANIAKKLVPMLQSIKKGHGAWTLSLEQYIHDDSYVFEGNSKNESSYGYAEFLCSLGIISTPDKWKEDEQIVSCPLTDRGHAVLRILNKPNPEVLGPAIGDTEAFSPNNTILMVKAENITMNLINPDLSTKVGDNNKGPVAGGIGSISNLGDGGDHK